MATTSRFNFSNGGQTTRCPSLVKECPGPQRYDGNNDVQFMALGGCCTLGVTWYSTSRDEADMALNSKFRWTTSGGSGYDLETVMLHENGHVAGLGHSSVSSAVMYAYYGGRRPALTSDDICAISTLYPEPGFAGC
jgi:Matrixin